MLQSTRKEVLILKDVFMSTQLESYETGRVSLNYIASHSLYLSCTNRTYIYMKNDMNENFTFIF